MNKKDAAARRKKKPRSVGTGEKMKPPNVCFDEKIQTYSRQPQPLKPLITPAQHPHRPPMPRPPRERQQQRPESERRAPRRKLHPQVAANTSNTSKDAGSPRAPQVVESLTSREADKIDQKTEYKARVLKSVRGSLSARQPRGQPGSLASPAFMSRTKVFRSMALQLPQKGTNIRHAI